MKAENYPRLIWSDDFRKVKCSECGQAGCLAYISLAPTASHPASGEYLCGPCSVSYFWSGLVVALEEYGKAGKIMVTDDPLLAFVIAHLDQTGTVHSVKLG